MITANLVRRLIKGNLEKDPKVSEALAEVERQLLGGAAASPPVTKVVVTLPGSDFEGAWAARLAHVKEILARNGYRVEENLTQDGVQLTVEYEL